MHNVSSFWPIYITISISGFRMLGFPLWIKPLEIFSEIIKTKSRWYHLSSLSCALKKLEVSRKKYVLARLWFQRRSIINSNFQFFFVFLQFPMPLSLCLSLYSCVHILSLSLSSHWSHRVSLSFWSIVRKAAGVYDSFAMLWRRYKSKNVTHFNEWHCHQLSCPRQMKRAIFLNTFHVWWKLCLLTITLNFKYHDKPAPVLQIAHWIHCWCRAQTGYTELINHHHCRHLFINQLKFNPSIVPKPNLLLCKRSI